MAWWNNRDDEDEEEETGSASSRVIDAVRNLYQKVVDNQRRAVEADQAVARETARQVTSAPKSVYKALDRATQSTAQANMAVQRAQTQKVQDAARNIYGAYQQQQERAARDQMAEQARQRQAQQQRMQAATAALYRQSQIQQQANRNQAETMAGLYTSAANSLRSANELYQRQLAGTDTGNRANELMTQPVLERANKRQSSLESGDPNTGAGKYIKYLTAADFRENSLAREDNKDATYNYINGLNGERERQQGYAFQRGADSGMEKYLLMTDSERGVYNYLYNTQGKTAANGFLARLDPELNEQYYSGQSAWQTEQATQDAANGALWTAATVAQQPVRTLNSAAAFVGDVIDTVTGNEIDPNGEFRRASALTQDIRGAISQALDEKYPKKILGLGAGDLYQDVCSALDSTMNRMVSGFLGEGIAGLQGISDVKVIDKLTSRIAGILMSGEVTATTIAEGKKKGYSNLGATTLGAVRGGLEYLFEAIGGERVTRLIRTQPGTVMNAIVQVMFSEAIEEVATDIGNEGVSLLTDALFGTDESFLRQTHAAFEKEGSDNPWRDTWIMAGLQLWKSAAGGALSSFGSAGVTYAQQRSTVNSITKMLNTDRKGVQALMRELGTDNPSAVEFMAKAFGTDSVEALREKASQFENVEAAVDAAEREIGARENAQPETVRETAPGNEGLRSEFAARVATEEGVPVPLEGIAPERQAAVEQAAQDIRNAAAQPADLNALREKAGAGIQTLTDAELGQYVEQLQRQNAMAGALTGYTEKQRAQLRQELRAATEEQTRRQTAPAQQQATKEGKAGFTGGSGMQYSQEQADALAQLSNDTLIAGAESSFTVPYNRLGITEEQAAALRNAGLLGTETAEDGSTFEYLNDAAIYDERQRRREQDRAARAQIGSEYGIPVPIPRYGEQTEQEISPEDIQGEPVSRNKTAEESMTMDQARRMIEMVFNEYVRQEGEYRSAEDWVQNADVGDVAMYLENSENAVEQYLNKIPELWDDFDVEDIVEAYRAGTLTGGVKQGPARMDTSMDTGRQDNRFYAPKTVNATGETWSLANQRVTNANRQDVYQARKDLLFFAHQPGAAEELGITQKELNARLRSWSNYSANGRAVSQRINEGVAPENQWYGTYDDNGNVIPLSERFDVNNPDIRFQRFDGQQNREHLEQDPRVAFGSSGRTYTNTDTIEFQYAIVPLDTLLASHDRYGNTNAEYPAELQPRDRTRATSQGDIDRMARNLNPDLLADSKTAQNGAPIVTDTGIVISGNGRTAAIQAAYESGNSGAYQQYLQEHAAEFGIDPDTIPENPVLVRVAKDSGNAAQLARDLNVTTTAAMSATETAQVDADKLQGLMDSVVLDEDADITAASNRGFVQRFVEEIVPESERGAMYDANGNLSKAGLSRIQNAIFATAYGDESRLARMAEYTDDTAKNITKALVNASSDALQLQSSVKNGTSYDVDVTGAIMRALDLYEQSRAEGRDFADFMAQYRMDDVDGTAWDIAQFIAAHKRSAKAIGEYFSALYDEALSRDPNQTSLFGGEENGPTIEEILRGGENRYLEEADSNYLGYEPGERREAGSAIQTESNDRGSNSEGTLAERTLGVSENDTEAAKEADRIDGDMAADLTTPKKGIDIMPDETEAAVSSAIGLTEEDNAALGGGDNMLSSLFGPTAEETATQEARATEQATKEGNAALSQYIEDLPDDPMDLYTKQQKVTAEKKGEERITTKKNPKKKTLRQKVSEGWHGFIRLMANDGDAIHQAGRQTGNKALDGMFFYAKAARQRAQDWIQGKRMSFGLDKTGDSLNSIFDPIRAKGDEYYKDFQLYVYHMLNVERMSRSTGDEVPALKDTLKQLRQKAHRHGIDLGSMTDDELQRRAQAYKEGGVGGLYDEIGDLASQYWETKKDLMRAERQQNKPVFGWDEGAPDADESKKISDDLLAAHPEFEQEAQKVYDYIDDLLQYRVDAGLITQADMDNLKSIYPHYVPVMYDYEDAPQEIRKGGLTVSSTIKSAQGGDTTLLPLHYALARQTLSVMRNAGFQQLGGTVLGEYENSGELMGKWVQDVKESEAAWDPSMADNEVPQTKENVITVFRNGKRYDMTLSPDMAYAFNSLQPSGDNNALEQFAAGANNLFKALCTSKNPLFVFTNSMRDFQEALFYSTDTARWLKNFPRAYKQIAGNGKYWQMYQAMGGVYNSLFDWATGEDIGDKGGKPGKVEMLNMWVEQAPRLSEFMTVLENAERDHGNVTQDDLMEAFNAAAEVTTNFSRSGKIGRYINRYVVPFWNPGVQGLSKVVRTATETRGFKNWATLALKTAALGMLPQILNGLLYRDDDEWDIIDDEVKANYYLFKSKDGVWVKIPKGRVLAALSVPVVGTMEAMRGDDVKWGKLGKAAISSVAPNNPLTTNLFSPIVETRLWDSNDPGKTWYGGDIESKRLQSYAPGQRYDESTDAISKWIGGKLDVSPKKLSYILDQYSGVLGDLILPYLTPKAERGVYAGDYAVPLSNAFMSRFTTDTVTSNTIGNEYYGLLDQLTWKANAGDDAAAMAKKYMNRAGGTVSDYYAQIRKIENDPNLSDKEKTTLTRELRKQLNAYEQQVTADAKAYLETAQEYVDQHPETDYTDDKAVDAYVEGFNSTQSSEKNMITADDAARKMQDEVYREANRKHFGSEYALQVYNKDVYAKAQQANEDAGVSYDDYYDYYFGTKNLKSDKDENGKTVNGSKKEKVVAYIDGMDIPDEQKDALYLASGYTENTLEDAPWNGGTGKYTGSSGSGSGRKKTPETRLKEYRDVQAKKAADPNYNPAADGHAWTVWADRAVESGIKIEDAVRHMTELGKFTADYDQYGKPITGSKKEKVVDYIQSQKGLTKAQKDTLYLYIYGENSLRFTPWHGWTGDKKKTGSRSRRRGGRRRSGGSTSRSVKQVGKLAKGYSSNGIDASALFGTSGSGRNRAQNASAASDLLEIINNYYGGNALAAAMDGGKRAKGRTTVDFKL